MIILDTDALTFLERRENQVSAVLRGRLTELSAGHEIVTTVISYEEQTRGWFAVLAKAKSADAQVAAYDRLLAHLATFRSIKTIRYSRGGGCAIREAASGEGSDRDGGPEDRRDCSCAWCDASYAQFEGLFAGGGVVD